VLTLRSLPRWLVAGFAAFSSLVPSTSGRAATVVASVYQWATATAPVLAACQSDWRTGLANYALASGPYEVGVSYATVIDTACRALRAAPAQSSAAPVLHDVAVSENRWFFDVTTGGTATYRQDVAAMSRALTALHTVIVDVEASRVVPAPTTWQSLVKVDRPENGVLGVSWSAPSGPVQSYEVLLATPTAFTRYLRTGTIAPSVDVTGLSPNSRRYVITSIPANGTYYVVLWAHYGPSSVVTPRNYPQAYLTTGTTTTTTTVPSGGGPHTMPTAILWDSPTTATVTFTPTTAAITAISQALSDVNSAAVGTGQLYAVRLGISATTNGGSPATCVIVGSNTTTWLFPQVYFCRNLQASLVAAAQYTFVTAQGLTSPRRVTFTAITSNDNLG